LLVTLQKEGVATVAQEGRESRVGAGDIFVLDPTRPFHIETGEIRTHSVYLPRDRMRQLVPNIDDLTALTVPGHGGPGAMFRAVLDELFDMVPHLTDDTADRIADMIPHVLVTALSALDRSDTMAQSRLKQFHRERVCRYIHDNLSDPQLDVSMIATATSLSARYLYQLFDNESVTLMKSVWNKRLDNCHRELATASLRGRSISEIAYSWGFSDVAHFSRAFRERYKISPREFRKQALLQAA
jgi:AraC-like DNA-binding protein